MKRSTKAALLSCFVLPGVGHLYLKRFVFGLLLLACTTGTIYFITSTAVESVLEVTAKIQSGGAPLGANAIADLVSQQSRVIEESTNPATLVLIALWLVGIFDSYRVGRLLDIADGLAGKKET